MGRGSRSAGSGWWVLIACGLVSACHAPDDWHGLTPECAQLQEGAIPLPPTPGLHTEEDGLPVLHLFFAGSLPEENGDQSARLVYRDRCYVVEARLRGDTSRKFPKRSYTLDFPKSAPFEEPALGNGLTGHSKIVLISPFNDNSYLRSRLAFSLWNLMSPDHVPVKTYSAVLYRNGEYWGLYTVSDHIDRHLLSAHGLDPAGHLFKAVGIEANFSRQTRDGWPKDALHEGFEKKEGQPETGPEAFEIISSLTAFVADASAEQFRAERGAWMDTRDYEDWWIFSTLAATNDSVSKNAYHYRAPGPGDRWRFIPWDLDASLGQEWNTRRSDPELLDDFVDKNLLFSRMLEDPAIAEPMRERYRALLRSELRAEVVLGLIDQYSQEIAVAARRDEARWLADYRGFFRWNNRTDFTTHEQEVAYLRQWVRKRWQSLEQRLP
jgi:spore coat protein H